MDPSPPPGALSSPTPPSLPSNSSSPPPLSPPPSPSSPPPMASNSTTSPLPPSNSPPPSTSPPPDLSPPPSPPSEANSSPPPPSSNPNPPPSPPKDAASPIPQQPSPLPPEASNSPPPPEASNSPPPLEASNSPPLFSPPPPQPSNSPPLIPPPNDSSRSTLSPPPPFTQASNFPPPPISLAPASNGTLSSLSPPTGISTTISSPTSQSSSSSLTMMPLVIGLAAGTGILLTVLLVWFILSCTEKKKRKPQAQTNGYSGSSDDASKAGKKYYESSSSPYSWRDTRQPPADHVVQIPPPPGAIVGTASRWQTPPPPGTSSFERDSSLPSPHGLDSSITLGFNKSTFTYNELAAATNGFAFETIIGQGGFGYVHKGVLPSGQEVAVKCLKAGSGQGDREFQAEVEIISRVHHRHLVSLEGYCIAGSQRMLVYEFLPNKTLEYHLHGKDLPPMDWSTRLRIALGSAKGLAYLHEDCHPRIIHRDIKGANILLDFNFEAKVADFGLAKLTSDNYTHVSTRIMGTFGYLAPEYAASGKLTDKSDVFSFGVMLLELITGRRPVDPTGVLMEDSLVDWARPRTGRALEENNFNELADPRLGANYAPHEMARMVACAGACIRHSARRRPKMSQIVRALEGDGSFDDLSDWPKSTGQSSATGELSSTDYDTISYSENMRQFKKVASTSQNYVSSEYGGTSEYGLNPSSSSSDSEELGKDGSRRHGP